MPQPPAGGPNRPSGVRPQGTPASQPPKAPAPGPRPSGVAPRPAAPAPATPAKNPGTQRIPSPAPAKPAAANPGTQRIPAPAGAKPAAGPGTQRIPKPPAAAPTPEAAPKAAPSSKNLRPSKMEAALAEAAAAPPETGPKKMGKGKLLFNLFIYLSIPASLVIIFLNKDKLMKNKKAIEDRVGDKPAPPVQQVSADQQKLDDAEAILVKAQTMAKQTEFVKDDDKKKLAMLEEANALLVKYLAIIEVLAEDPKYKGPDFEYITKRMENAVMLRKTVRTEIAELQPKEEIKAAGPNTAALATLASWKGKTQAFKNVFLTPELSPAKLGISAMDFKTSALGQKLNVRAMPANRMMELLQGNLREEINKMDQAGKDAKQAELAADIMEFEGEKFGVAGSPLASEQMAYMTRVHGYIWKDRLAVISVSLRDDRGIDAYPEYASMIFSAYGNPQLGREKVGSMPEEHRLMWRADGIVYKLYAIGSKSGMDYKLTAFDEAAYTEFVTHVGGSDPFGEKELEPWNGSAEEPPKDPPKEPEAPK